MSLPLFVELEEAERYRLLIDAITDYAIYMLDANGYVSSWNPGARRFKGYEAAEIVGQHFSRFYTDEDQAAGLPAKALGIAASEGRFETEGWRLKKDGSRFWAHVVVDPIRGDAGEIVGFAKVTRDLSERRQSQQLLERTQQALAQTQKLEALGKLTGGIAHDFNNLLTAITGCLELLEKRLPPDDTRSISLLRNALHGAARGSTLTQRMLAFARRQELNISAVSVRSLVEGMEDLIGRSLGPEFLLQVDVAADLPAVRSDASQLEAAILNLAINARDAMPSGGTIRIHCRAVEPKDDNEYLLPTGRYVGVAVADEGQGMDAETAARATEPFFTTKGIGKGTGLGLSMVQGLTEQSGGALRIHSAVDRGTTVELILPVADENQSIAAVTDSAPAVQETQPHGIQTILVVDDDDLVLISIIAMLEDIGYRVISADNGEAALEIVSKDPRIDLVITDQAMPGMTGLQLAQAIFAIRPLLPVILASGYAEIPEQTDALIRLAKPFRRADLVHAIAAALRWTSEKTGNRLH